MASFRPLRLPPSIDAGWTDLETLLILEAGVPFGTGLARSGSFGEPNPLPLGVTEPSAEVRLLAVAPVTLGFFDLNRKDMTRFGRADYAINPKCKAGWISFALK